MRYLIDTCVVLSALRSRRGASNALLRLVFEGHLRAVMHFKLLAEYRDVLLREENRLATGLSEEHTHRFLAAFIGVAEQIQVQYLWRPNLPDEDDNFIMEIAVAASPCTIVTYNVRDFRRGEQVFAGIRIAQPAEVLRTGGH